MAELAQVVDPEALDACDGARAKLSLDVDRSWMTQGASLQIAAPKRLPCARCDGGGCDGCERSGVLRGPDDPRERALRVELPPYQPSETVVVLRLTRPFRDHDAIAQLHLHLSPSDAPDARIKRLSPQQGATDAIEGRPRPLIIAALVGLAAVAAWLAANGF